MFKFFKPAYVASLEAENARLIDRLSFAERTLDSARFDLRIQASTVNKFKAQATAAKTAQAVSDKEKARLQQSVTDLRKHNSELGKQLSILDKEIEELEDELDAAEAANDCLLERNLQLSNKVAQLTFREMFAPRVTATEILLRDQLHSRDLTIQNGLNREEALVKERDALKAEVESLKQQWTALVKERNGLRFDLKRTIDNLETMFQLSSGAPISLGTISRIRAALWQLKARYGFSNAAPQGQPHAKAA